MRRRDRLRVERYRVREARRTRLRELGRRSHRPASLVLALVVAGAAAFGASRVPDALSRMEFFRVRGLDIRGAQFLSPGEVQDLLALPPTASVVQDVKEWEVRLREHPLVLEARIERRLPDSLRIVIRERVPVAFYPMTTLEPVDEEGQVLPIDPARFALDLPVLSSEVEGRSGELLTPAQLRALSREAARLAQVQPRFMARVSELALAPGDQVVARLTDPAVEVWFRAPASSLRIRQAMDALEDARVRFPDRAITTVDLRFDEQVVVRFSRAGRRMALGPSSATRGG